jgi:hypothetical protein
VSTVKGINAVSEGGNTEETGEWNLKPLKSNTYNSGNKTQQNK